MTTTTVLSEDTATIVHDDVPRFNWGAVIAGAVIAAAISFLLITIGSGLGLAITTGRNVTLNGAKLFLTLGAIYFLAAQAFGFAVGGHVTGRLMGPFVEESEEENFRADAHGLAVWALAVVFGLSVVALGSLMAAPIAAGQATTPAAYWADKLFAPTDPSAAPSSQGVTPGENGATTVSPSGSTQASGTPAAGAQTFSDAKAEASRLLTLDAAGINSDGFRKNELKRLVVQFAGLTDSAASQRVTDTENEMRAEAKEAADAARKGASYLAIWTGVALLFGAIVCVAATVSARWKEAHDLFGRRRDLSEATR